MAPRIRNPYAPTTEKQRAEIIRLQAQTGDTSPVPSMMGPASDLIGRLKAEVASNPAYWRAGSLRAICQTALVSNNLDLEAAYRDLIPQVGTPPLVFTRNPDPSKYPGERRGDPRVPKPLDEQYEALRTLLMDVRNILVTKGTPAPSDPIAPAPVTEPEPPITDPEPEPEPEPFAFVNTVRNPTPASNRPGMTPSEFLRTVREMRTYCTELEERGDPLTDVGLRILTSGRAMYLQGIPFEAALDAFAKDWPEPARQRFGIREYDYSRPLWMPPDPLPRTTAKPQPHAVMPYAKALAAARVPICLYGPAGTGKTTLAAMLAEELGLPFGLIPMTQGATPSWMTGAYTLDGFKTRPFLEILEHGGVFLWDELDASDPNLLLISNSTLDGADGFHNPTTGEFVKRHPDFIPVSAMNTIGNGSNPRYTGRRRLDLATLDRWKPGRIKTEIDPAVEEWIIEGLR